MNVILPGQHDLLVDLSGPTEAELAAIEAEAELISAELDVLDSEIALLDGGRSPVADELAVRRYRRARRRVLAVRAELFAQVSGDAA